MKTLYGRINDIEERLSELGGGNQCITSFYRNVGDEEPIKVVTTPSVKPVRINILVGDGFVPPGFLTS